MGLPPVIIHFGLGFSRLQKPSSYWGTPIYGNPDISHLFGNLASLGAPSGKYYMEYIYPISTARWCPPQ